MKVVLLAVLGTCGNPVWAGQLAAAPQGDLATCSCPDLFDALTAKVEANYPGYHMEVRGGSEQLYHRAKSDLRRQAQQTEGGLACTALLQKYVAWFQDGHLFVGGRPRVTTPEDSARLRGVAPRAAWTETDVRRFLETNASELDAVEGIWYDPVGLKLALVRSDMSSGLVTSQSRFIAFVLTSTHAAWQAGDVKAELTRLADGSYDVVMYDDVRVATRPHVFTRGAMGGGRLQREGLLLHIPPTTWGKLNPVPPDRAGHIHVDDPRAPTARIVDDHTVAFHIPSHLPTHAQRLRRLVEQYSGALAQARNLIIDLRGNEGGSTFVTDVFMPFLATPQHRAPRYLTGGAPAVLASEDNIAYFNRARWSPPGLVARLRAAEPGTWVSFADPQPGGDTTSGGETVVPMARPANVAILTDAMTVSAAEAFVLKAMRNEKVTLFGQPTGGSIDYQTMNIVSFGCRQAGIYLGYPTIIGSDRLPAGGVRPTGIVPDVLLDTEDDPVAQIIDHYNRSAN